MNVRAITKLFMLAVGVPGLMSGSAAARNYPNKPARLIGPANMPKEIVARLNREIVVILSQKDVIDSMLSQCTVPTPSSPEEFTAYTKSELRKWGDVVKLASIRTE